MNTTIFQQNLTKEYCFPDINNSCTKELQSSKGRIFLLFFLGCISISTVFLNLLVIISISHFRQLHTPTNLLIMSLAVADLLVGLIVMPINIMDQIDSCWYLGKTMCALYPVINYITVSASVGSLVFIALDRYVAITSPLLYSTRITISKTSLFIVVTWICSVLYNTLFYFFDGHLLHPDKFSQCVGRCMVVQSQSASTSDLFISFICPCLTMLFLYLGIFKVARYQAKSINAVERNNNAHGHRARKVNIKAAKTLGIAISVYLIGWMPFYFSLLSSETLSSMSVVWIMVNWLVYLNSSVNPLIYAIFYPWFRVSVKYIVTCRIFQASSSMFNLFPERF